MIDGLNIVFLHVRSPRIRQVSEWISGAAVDTVDVPVGCSVFLRELQRPSRRWAEKRFTDIRYWTPARGGHFRVRAA